MLNFEFLLPTRIVFGNDVIGQIGEKAKNFGQRALIVTDKGVLKTGIVEKIQRLLAAAQIEVALFRISTPTRGINRSIKAPKRLNNLKRTC